MDAGDQQPRLPAWEVVMTDPAPPNVSRGCKTRRLRHTSLSTTLWVLKCKPDATTIAAMDAALARAQASAVSTEDWSPGRATSADKDPLDNEADSPTIPHGRTTSTDDPGGRPGDGDRSDPGVRAGRRGDDPQRARGESGPCPGRRARGLGQ
jgi:hypothetical protein